ncbi:MAG: DUF1028 domain-containing protein [Chloroflexi bacterium]|nr:DUF1028 domain-containing protein [Chloroflexota bacterium]
MTYSIVARDPATGDIGIGVQTHQPTCFPVVWVKAGVGAVATQASTNIGFGPQGLALMENGLDARHTLDALLASDAESAVRQVSVMDAKGGSAVHTGARCIPYASHLTGTDYTVQSNMMLNEGVPEAMAAAFESAKGLLPVRILAALEAAEAKGGDIRGSLSAVLQVKRPGTIMESIAWDLRIDNHPDALVPLRRMVEVRLAMLELLTPGAVDPNDRDALLADAFARFERAQALAPGDEQAFWFAVTGLAGQLKNVEKAAEVLAPLFARAPRWRELLLRLPTEGLDDLKARFAKP